MAIDTLKFGDSTVALIVDGVEDTPWAACVVKMAEPSGIVVEIPYIGHGVEQFAPIAEWFREQSPPNNLLLRAPKGALSLFDNRWSGHSEKAGVTQGSIRPAELVLAEREGELSDPLLITEMRSYMDGLKEWARFTTVETDHVLNENNRIRSATFTVESKAELEWDQGEAHMKIGSDWTTGREEDDPDEPWRIFDWVVLESRFDEPRPFIDHYIEHRKIQQLLTLNFGHQVSFRRHKVRDERFPERFSLREGEEVHYKFVELISTQSVEQYARKPTPRKKLKQDILHYLPQVGAEGLARWAQEHERWKRFILPSPAVIDRHSRSAEDLIVSMAMSLEAAGYIIEERDGETEAMGYKAGNRPSTAMCVFRVLDILDLKWGGRIASNAALAHAIGNTYNSIKHYRDDFAPVEHLLFVAEVIGKISRLFTLHLIDPDGALLAQHREDGGMWRADRWLEVYDLRIIDGGEFEDDPGDPDDGMIEHVKTQA